MSFVLDSRPIGEAELGVYRRLLAGAAWKVAPGRDYQTADVTDQVAGVKRAFFLKLPPGAALHKHVDAGDCRTDHIVMQTNPGAMNWHEVDGVTACEHLAEGWRYAVDRTIPHWATNDGNEDRIHLLVEH